ncbi:MAG: LamG domain-containing protein, partial [Planctomycetota bacterium]
MYKQLIFLMSFIVVLGLSISVAEGADPSLVGWWRFDEGSGTTAYDTSTYGNDGTLQGGPQWVNGKLATALQFDGVDDFVDVPHAAILTVDTEVTVMAWINTSRHGGPGTEGWQGIIAKGNTTRSYSFYTQSSGALHFSTAGTGSSSSTQVPLNEWVHVCAMVVGGQHVYYINGQPAGTGGSGINLPGTADTENVVIGRSQEGATRSFLGMIDDARIYNRALTQEEIQEAMLGGDVQEARNPDPAHLALDVPVDANLGWTRGQYVIQDDVYFGTDPCMANLPKIATLSAASQDPLVDLPVDLIASTTYYWYVAETDSNVTHTPDGSWQFSTVRGEARPDFPKDGAVTPGVPLGDDIYMTLDFFPGATTVKFTGYF